MEPEKQKEEIVKKEEEKKRRKLDESDDEEEKDLDVACLLPDMMLQKDGKSKSQKALRALKKTKMGAGLANKIPTSR